MTDLPNTEPIRIEDIMSNNQNTTVPTVDIDSPNKAIQPKVIGAITGAGVGAAVSTITLYAIESLAKIDLPEVVEGAALVLVTALVTYVGGYLPKLRVPARHGRYEA